AALLERVGHYLKSGKNQYPPMIGVAELREAVAEKIVTASAVTLNPETQITVTSGATEALFCAIHATVTHGDEVIVFDPAYDSYEPAVALAGGATIHIPLTLPDYRIDWDALQTALSERTRLVVINTPHNPTGSILHSADLDRLAELIRPYKCWVLSDEVYEHIIFDGEIHASVLTHSELSEKSFGVFSFGKTYHATGWKIGYCIAPAYLSTEFRKVHQFNVFTTVSPMQWALADIVRDHPQHYLGLSEFYQNKRDTFRRLIESSRFKLLPSNGTFFQLANYDAISDRGDTEFANWITQEKGVAVIPLSPFYQAPPDTRIVRFCFAKQDETLQQAAEILCQI
ncbi:MAG: methionine aminotransferase, partial [Gammaproteobacteria bacterium]|nr:methionine aminotransferase [Gammaproteobacteria bacterium]